MQQQPPANIDLGLKLVLGITGLLLIWSAYFVVVAPFPLALVSLLGTRKSGFTFITALVALYSVFSLYVIGSYESLIVCGIVAIVAVCVSEIVRLCISPVKGIFLSGMLLLTLICGGVFGTLKYQGLSLREGISNVLESYSDLIQVLKKNLAQSTDDQSFEMLSILDQPEILTTRLIEELPSYLVGFVFVLVWINLFLIVRSRYVNLHISQSQKMRKQLTKLKLPDQLIWLVIASMGVVLLEDFVPPAITSITMVLLSGMGVFYFFQGFAIYIALLDYMKIGGLFRVVLVVVTLVSAASVLMFVGLFDVFFNFRKFFKKTKQK